MLTVPILVYVLRMSSQEAIATSLWVVGLTSVAGLIQHARLKNVRWRSGGLFGSAAMLGAYGGGRLGQFLPPILLLALFATMMVGASTAMFLRGQRPLRSYDAQGCSRSALLSLGVLIGSFTGLVGAGGGFLIVPALSLMAGLGIRAAVGTSLLVMVMNASAGFVGYASHTAVDFNLALMVSGCAMGGSFVGVTVAKGLSPGRLHHAFAWLVLSMAGGMLGEIGAEALAARLQMSVLWAGLCITCTVVVGGRSIVALLAKRRQASGQEGLGG